MRNRFSLRAAWLAVCCATLAVVLSACGPTAQSADSAKFDLPPLALGQQPVGLSDADRLVGDILMKSVPEVRFPQIKFEDALNFLRDTEKVNINPNWAAMEAAGITKTTEISLVLHNVTFETALRELLTKASGKEGMLDYLVRGGVIKVSTVEDLTNNKYIQIYDVRDLLARIEWQLKADGADMFRQAFIIRRTLGEGASTVTLSTSSSGPTKQTVFDDGQESCIRGMENSLDVRNYHREAVITLMELPRTMCLPDSWAPTGDANMKELAGMLIVKQTSNGHRELAKLLQQLRESFAAAEQGAPAGSTHSRPALGAVPRYRTRSHEPRPSATTGFGTHGTSPDID
jgi:hypothetical protein